MMNKYRNEDNALTVVFGGLSLLLSIVWVFVMHFGFFPMLKTQALTLEMSILSSVIGFVTLGCVCMWLYLIYPSIRRNEEDIATMLEREASIRIATDTNEEDKILLSAYLDNEVTSKEKEYVTDLLITEDWAWEYYLKIKAIDTAIKKEAERDDCPYCGLAKTDGAEHYKCWIK
jgi:hypothetical protein|tara:strand:- start:826 stop:1347 length:522 start_codon:yes stop_codon:yes gene_type:complete